MTNSMLLRALRAIDGHNAKVGKIINQIRSSGRPDADQVADAIAEQCHSIAWAEHVGGHYLGDEWVNENGTYKYRESVEK